MLQTVKKIWQTLFLLTAPAIIKFDKNNNKTYYGAGPTALNKEKKLTEISIQEKRSDLPFIFFLNIKELFLFYLERFFFLPRQGQVLTTSQKLFQQKINKKTKTKCPNFSA